MLFYRCEFSPAEKPEQGQEREYDAALSQEAELFNEAGDGKELYFPGSLRGRNIGFC